MKRVAGWICQLALLAVATFLFVVLYDHGPTDFMQHLRPELGRLLNGMTGGGGGNFPPSK